MPGGGAGAGARARRNDAPVLQHHLEGNRGADARTGGSGLLLAVVAASDQGQRRTLDRLRPVRSFRFGRRQPARQRDDPLRHRGGAAEPHRNGAPLRHPDLSGQHHEPPRVRRAGLQREHARGRLPRHAAGGFPRARDGRRLLPQVGQLPRLEQRLAGAEPGPGGPDRHRARNAQRQLRRHRGGRPSQAQFRTASAQSRVLRPHAEPGGGSLQLGSQRLDRQHQQEHLYRLRHEQRADDERHRAISDLLLRGRGGLSVPQRALAHGPDQGRRPAAGRGEARAGLFLRSVQQRREFGRLLRARAMAVQHVAAIGATTATVASARRCRATTR